MTLWPDPSIFPLFFKKLPFSHTVTQSTSLPNPPYFDILSTIAIYPQDLAQTNSKVSIHPPSRCLQQLSMYGTPHSSCLRSLLTCLGQKHLFADKRKRSERLLQLLVSNTHDCHPLRMLTCCLQRKDKFTIRHSVLRFEGESDRHCDVREGNVCD